MPGLGKGTPAFHAAPAELYRSMGLASRQLGNAGEAAASFRRYLELKPAAPDAELVRSYL